MNHNYKTSKAYIRVATGCPIVSIGNVSKNVRAILEIYEQASNNNASVIVFPELSLTGYTLGDLFHQVALYEALDKGLRKIVSATNDLDSAILVGFPWMVGNSLYNCAAVIARGKIVGVVPKSNLPTYNEFYESRWFDVWSGENLEIEISGQKTIFGNDILFNIDGVKLGVEICEDLWVVSPPSIKLASRGAQLIANLSASPEQVGKAQYRRDLVRLQSASLVAGYIYAGCHTSESTAEIVMGGHQIIASNGQILAESKPFENNQLLISDIDIEHIDHDRMNQHMANDRFDGVLVGVGINRKQKDLIQSIDPRPFMPTGQGSDSDERLRAILEIQANGLAWRMKATNQTKLVLGLSGGLDSTLALLVAFRAVRLAGLKPKESIHTITMPGPASSKGTQTNAQILAKALGVKNQVIPIGDIVDIELDALGHSRKSQDITYENVQARIRTSVLFNYGNMYHCLVLGTGDLSEIALGWCTYNADQQSHYNVNASIPKTLVKYLVKYTSDLPDYKSAKKVLQAILDTPISPELTSSKKHKISQTTEDLIGPYDLHDFYLYHLIRWGDSPDKIYFLAKQAFAGEWTNVQIEKYLKIFLSRFRKNQFKRDNMPNGPKVGSVSLSPRGDWRMPSDMPTDGIWGNVVQIGI